MAMSDPTRDFERPSLKNAQFEGYAIVTMDPDFRQRVRVRIPVLHRDIPDEHLPMANPLNGGTANAGSNVGSVNVPDRNAKLVITYPTDDPHYPQYGPSPTSDDVNKDNELLKEDYPNTKGETDSFGNRFSTNRATGDITIAHQSGSIIHIDGGGGVTIASAGDLNIGVKGNLSIAVGGRIRIGSGGTTSIDASQVLLNGGTASAPNIPGKRTKPKITDQSGKTKL